MLSRLQGKQNLWMFTEGHCTKCVSSSLSWHSVHFSVAFCAAAAAAAAAEFVAALLPGAPLMPDDAPLPLPGTLPPPPPPLLPLPLPMPGVPWLPLLPGPALTEPPLPLLPLGPNGPPLLPTAAALPPSPLTAFGFGGSEEDPALLPLGPLPPPALLQLLSELLAPPTGPPSGPPAPPAALPAAKPAATAAACTEFEPPTSLLVTVVLDTWREPDERRLEEEPATRIENVSWRYSQHTHANTNNLPELLGEWTLRGGNGPDGGLEPLRRLAGDKCSASEREKAKATI